MSTQIIRCPVCLISQAVNNNIPPDKVLYCGNCKRNFAVKNGLPLKNGVAITYAAEPSSSAAAINSIISTIEPTTARNAVITWIIGAFIGLIVIKESRSFIATLNGPEFLTFYVFLFVGIWVSAIAMRKLWEDSSQVTLIALLIFELVGLIRYLDASAAGMHKFTYMFMIMSVGGLLLFLRYDHSSSSNWSDSSSSSCSSGCGGGGGCGGCGG